MDVDEILDRLIDIQDYIISVDNPNDPTEHAVLTRIFNKLSIITEGEMLELWQD